jgi:hypothetical protein
VDNQFIELCYTFYTNSKGRAMTMTFRLNTDEMTPAFFESFKLLFQGKEIEIIARPIDSEFEKEKEEFAQSLREVEAGNSYPINESFWDKMHSSIEAV